MRSPIICTFQHLWFIIMKTAVTSTVVLLHLAEIVIMHLSAFLGEVDWIQIKITFYPLRATDLYIEYAQYYLMVPKRTGFSNVTMNKVFAAVVSSGGTPIEDWLRWQRFALGA